jgi:antirestriction protein ArdC
VSREKCLIVAVGEAYYATLGHECCHWTCHETRLNRELGWKRWGDEGYAAEELVAELGSGFLCADLGLARIRPASTALR